MPAAQISNKIARIRPVWIVWAALSLVFAIYISMARIASHTTTTKLRLDLANIVHVKVFRLFDDTLQFSLNFLGNGREQRPDLGSYISSDKKEGLLKFKPGAEIQVLVSVPPSSPLRYEAMPLERLYHRGQNERAMTTNLAIRPGVYHWPPPPSMPVIHLHAGFNSVTFEVVSVDTLLAGETVSLAVLPPLGVQIGQASVAWLWLGLFWPLFLIPQVLWAVCLCSGGLRRRKKSS